MAETAHLAWYRQGTVSVTDGSTTVTGHGTNFLSAGINQGAALRIDNRFYVAEIKRVVSDTELELATTYYGGTVNNASYSIDRNHQSTLPATLAARLAKAMGNWEARYDLDMQTITGKSAYEIAVEEGFTGTKAQWLESLKGAGEIVTLNDRTNILTYNNAGAHNAFYRGKDLGTTITAAQITAIRNGTYKDIYPGDYWRLPIDGTTTAYVVGCSSNHRLAYHKPHVLLWLRNSNWNFSINDTDNVEGGFLNTKMYTEHFPYMLAKINEVIPDEYILPFLEEVSDSINSSNNVDHYTVIDNNFTNHTGLKIGLPSYTNIMGLPSSNLSYRIAGNNPDWPLFRLNPRMRSYMVSHWLNESWSVKSWGVLNWEYMRYGFAASTTTNQLGGILACPYIHIG